MAHNLKVDVNSVSDEVLAERLRRENNDQFHTLVRMHLSFVLDLNTDDNESLIERGRLKKWSFVPFNKKVKCFRGVMDGIPLTQEGICQVYQLIEFLRKEENICIEGIFRRTGSLSRQQELRHLLNEGTTFSLEGNLYSVHDCASVLKGFLAELPEPLLTDAYYPIYCQIAELCGVPDKKTQGYRLLPALQLLLLLLPYENRSLLKDVLDLLYLTASYEHSNKMSAENLATLFTPHLLCPRKLTPVSLHTNSQILSGIVAFLITNCKESFQVPPKLAVDIRAYFVERERRKLLSPKNKFDESVSDNFAANTVYSFVDHERTAKENQSNPTETALAQLYAHIQSMPESSRKRKLVKQFNKENGQGTPLQVMRSNLPKNKSISNSIKKHIFQKSLLNKVHRKNDIIERRASSEELLNSPSSGLTPKSRLFCNKCNTSEESINNNSELSTKSGEPRRSLSEPDLAGNKHERLLDACVTSTPACINKAMFTPENNGRKSMSPITRSTQRMCKAMQETMMTPRSRKPVLLISGTDIKNLPNMETDDCPTMDSVDELPENEVERTDSPSLSEPFREYLSKRSLANSMPEEDSTFSSCTDDYSSKDIKDLSESKISSSMLHCLNGYCPLESSKSFESSGKNESSIEEKELVLRPKQFDANGKPIVYETSF